MDTLPPMPPDYHAERAVTLALRLAQAENALHALTSGQADAIINADGQAFLLRPAQEHFREHQRRLHIVLQSAADVIVILDRGGRIVFENRAVYRLLGYETGWLLDKVFFDFVHPEDLPRLYSAFFNVIEEFRPDAAVGFRHLHRDGTYRLLETMISKLRDASVHEVIMVSRDESRKTARWSATDPEEPRDHPISAGHTAT